MAGEREAGGGQWSLADLPWLVGALCAGARCSGSGSNQD